MHVILGQLGKYGTIKMEAGPRVGKRPASIKIGSLNTEAFRTSVDVVCT